MKKTLIGYFIRRAVKDVDAMRGKTFSAYGHKLYPTRELAQDALDNQRAYDMLNSKYEYDVAEAWMGDE